MISDKQKLLKEKLLEFMDQTGESWYSIGKLSGTSTKVTYHIRDDAPIMNKSLLAIEEWLENYPRTKQGKYVLRDGPIPK